MVEQLKIVVRVRDLYKRVQIILSQKMHLFSYIFHLLCYVVYITGIQFLFPTAISSSAGG